ncbi:hypothetical protein, partial [Flavobacterium sp.]|uniref:hypothetical protein n=1 Tax=Flavobacterium sp. TaxID=239 RepID=UPI0037BFC106
KAAWDAYAASKGLTAEGQPTGCYIDEIGPIVTTPAVIGEDGEIVTPAVMDDRHHVNVRIVHLPYTVAPDETVVTRTMADLAAGNTQVEWIDPATVDNPRRIFAGGMSYWMPEVEA